MKKANHLLLTFIILFFLVAIVLIVSFGQFVKSVQSLDNQQEIKYATNQQVEVLDLINGYRKVNGLPELKLNNRLDLSSYFKVNEMKKLNYWGHNNTKGEEPWRHFYQVGYDYNKAGENLAKCYTDNVTMVQAWIDSPKHKEVMLGDYKDFGMAVESFNGCEYVVTHYGKL